MTTNLPAGWVLTTLENIVEIFDSKRVPVKKSERDKRPGDVPYYGATGQAGWIDKPIFDEELLLLGEDGVPFLDPFKSKAYIIDGPAWVNNHAHVLRAITELTTNRFLKHQLDWMPYEGRVTGTTRLKLTQRVMRQLPILLPGVGEQTRIVAAIEEHFSRLNAATSAASAAARKATVSRHSVLLDAFSGRLSMQNSEDEPALKLLDRIAESRSRSKSRLSTTTPRIDDDVSAPPRELPPRWAWARLQDLVAAEPRAITDGPFGSNLKTVHYTETGPRVIRLQNIGDGEFRREDAHISSDHYESLLAHSVRPDDLIVASLGQSLPRACLVPNWVPPAIVKADCIRVRLHPEVNRSYVNLALQDPRLRRETDVDIKGVGRPRLGLQKIRQLPVPVAPRAEQDRIVEAVEEHFSRLTAANSAVSAATLKIQALRRAVLARAFAGQLVRQ